MVDKSPHWCKLQHLFPRLKIIEVILPYQPVLTKKASQITFSYKAGRAISLNRNLLKPTKTILPMTTEAKASWVTAKPEDVKNKIIELAKQGKSPEKIGLILRDEHGIPKTALLGIRIKKVLNEAGLWKDPEMENSKIKIENLAKHSEKNKHDHTAKRTLTKISANFSRKIKKS